MGGIAALSTSLVAGTGFLGAWTPGTYPVGSSGFSVDTQVRNDVVAFWHAVYKASEGYESRHGWTGNYTAAAPYDSGVGTLSTTFIGDVERRLNFHRALCGVPAAAKMNTGSTVVIDANDPTNLYHPASNPPLAAATTKGAAAQRGAYMIARTYGYFDGTTHPPLGDAYAGVSHNPDAAKCVAWTTAAWNANHHGNLALGHYGPGAVDSYFAENAAGISDWNTNVGHRRMLLHPVSTDFATGDTPGAFDTTNNAIRPPTNVLYVVQKPSEVSPVPARFIPYPPAGFFPAPLNSRYWSLSYPGANFAAATVTVTDNAGKAVPATVVTRNGSFGYPAIVWDMNGTAASAMTVTADTRFNVTVAGITGSGVPASHTYSVTLIHPDQITSDQSVFGPSMPATAATSTYQITPPPVAEALQVNCFQALTTAWTEGAEDAPTPRILATTSGTYAFRSTGVFSADPSFRALSGAKSFRMTFPTSYEPVLGGPREQSFEVDRFIVPATGAKLSFKFQRGYMSAGSNLTVETSTDGGASWSTLGEVIKGNASNLRDTAITTTTRDLPASTTPLRVRFRYHVTPGQGVYADELYPTYPTGIFVDDITTTNCQWLELRKTNDLANNATTFDFNATTAGTTLTDNLELRLWMRTKLGGRWMPYGDLKPITLEASAQTTAPTLSPPAGTVSPGQTITLTGDGGATIHYRLNGGPEQSAPTPVTSITMPASGETLTITAYAKKPGRADSSTVLATFTAPAQPTSAPVFSLPSGDPLPGQTVTITGDEGATIHYRINDGIELSAPSPVTGITIPPFPNTLSLSAYASKTGLANSPTTTATYAASALNSWIASYFPGITDPAIIGPNADPDADGQPNLLEVTLGGNPNSKSDNARTFPRVADSEDPDLLDELVVTIAVRTGFPAFTGAPSPSATLDGITCTILGSWSLADDAAPVTQVTLATSGLPAPPAGCEYRSFSLTRSADSPAKGFLRIKVSKP